LARYECEQLSLFDFGGVDLVALRETRDRLTQITSAPLTVRGYASDWRVFERWCIRTGKHSLPAEPDTLSLYVTWLLTELGRKLSTAERHVSAIAHHHRRSKYPSPVTPDVRQVLNAVRRERKEKPQGKKALSVRDLVKVVSACNPETNMGSRDRALIVLGFATSLRRSELARLELADLTFHEQGLSVFVPSSKTDQNGKGRFLAVWPGRRASTDPVRVLRHWIDKRGKWAGPLITRITRRGDIVMRSSITGEAINEIVKRVVARAGLDPKPYGAHSLRAGAVTACAELGRSDQEIMNFSGHESAKVMRMYVRPARLFSGRNPLAGAL
jgi:integrase